MSGSDCQRGLSIQQLTGRRPARRAIKLHELLSSGGVLRLLVVTPAAGEPREPHGQARVVFELSPTGRVVGRQCEFGAEHLQHQARLKPHVSWDARIDPSWPLRPDQALKFRRQPGKLGIGETRATLADRLVKLRVRVIGGQQHSTVCASAPAAPGVRAYHDEVDRVCQLGAIVPFELDPHPAAGASLVDRVRARRLTHQTFRAVGNGLFEGGIQRWGRRHLVRCGQAKPVR